MTAHSHQSDDKNACKLLTSAISSNFIKKKFYFLFLDIKLPVFDFTSFSTNQPKIIFSRRSHAVDVKNSLIELNADRNLFVTMPQVEIEGI